MKEPEKRGRGNPNLDRDRNTDTTAAQKARSDQADEFAQSMYDGLMDSTEFEAYKKSYCKRGKLPVEKLTRFLNFPSAGFETRTTGSKWHRSTVYDLLDRMDDVMGEGAKQRLLEC